MEKRKTATREEIARANGGEAGFHRILVRVFNNKKMHASLASASIEDGQPVEVGAAMVARIDAASPQDVARDVAEMAEMLGIVMTERPGRPAVKYRSRAQMEAKLAELEAEHAAIVHEDSAIVRQLNATYANRIAGLRYALGEDTLPSIAKGVTQ